ncbi:MAG TPA: sugar phosphate isomerase/epimerase [Candidatus Dormibacteraeota bacterium]|nr:sugar phosphate isomerase/epimerase [Candidatus Dormibacteraeota bacterium]
MNRRTFIESSIAATIIAGRPAWASDDAHKIDRVGLQLYTVRDAMKNDFEGTLAKVAGIGYREVEFAGYFGRAPKEIRSLLDGNNLSSPSEHVPYDTVEKKWPETLDAAHIVGHTYIVCPSIDETQRKQRDGWKHAAELFNRAGEASQKAGIQFAYHNHTFEFESDPQLGGKFPYDFLLANTDPKFVNLEMDLGWATVAKQDPVAYFDRYPGRFPLVHVKDFTKDGHMTEVGSGAIDWRRIFAQSGKAGIKHYFVEHDEPKSPFDSIRTSYQYLHDLRF